MTRARFNLILAIGAILLSGTTVADAQQRMIRAIHNSGTFPMAFVEGTGPSQGFMIDVCNTIAADNGWAIEYQAMVNFADLVPTLAAGDADLICSISYAPERAEQVDFTPAIFEFGEGMIVPAADTTAYQSWADVRDQPVGAVRGTVHLAALQNSGLFSDLHVYDNFPALYQAVVSGEVKAGFNAQPILSYLLQSGDYPDLRLVGAPYQPSVVNTGNIAVRKDDPDLLAAVDASLAKLAADGTIRELRAEWKF